MRIAVDSSVILDVLTGDPNFGLVSREALRRAYDAGALVACDIVWGEVRAHFPEEATFRNTLATLGVIYEPLRQEAAELAGERWRKYCLAIRRKRDRDRLVADFLIGAHAQIQADALLSRDRGFLPRPLQRATPHRSDQSVGGWLLQSARAGGAECTFLRSA